MDDELRVISNSERVRPLFQEIGALYQAGDTAGVEKVLRRIDDGPWPLSRANVEHALGLVDKHKAGHRGPVNAGLGEPGGRLCDYCLSTEVVCYFPFEPFELVDVLHFRSGDRMYACAKCRDLVEARRWGDLIRWVGPTGHDPGVRQLWAGVSFNRTGPPVPYDPADDR